MSVPKEIGHVVLNVTDVERSTRFYRDVVGLKVSRYRPDGSGAAPPRTEIPRADFTRVG
jgi:catechol 2,3-dioxygenase-like lactoylglutathione lyase family enzyme